MLTGNYASNHKLRAVVSPHEFVMLFAKAFGSVDSGNTKLLNSVTCNLRHLYPTHPSPLNWLTMKLSRCYSRLKAVGSSALTLIPLFKRVTLPVKLFWGFRCYIVMMMKL